MKTSMKLAATSALGLLMLGSAGLAEDAHHPATPDANAAATEAAAPATEAAAPAVGMMAMMPDMMKMMAAMSPGMMGAPTEHVEGRIAFLHAELAITADQEATWSAFADAIRVNATGLAESGSMSRDDGATGVAARLLSQQHMLEAQLTGLKAINAALEGLNKGLSDAQRTTLNSLLPELLGLPAMEMMGYSMMTGMKMCSMAPNPLVRLGRQGLALDPPRAHCKAQT